MNIHDPANTLDTLERRKGYSDLQVQVKALKKDLDINTKITMENKLAVESLQKRSAAIISAFEAAEGAFKVLEFMGKLAKPILWLAGLSGTFVLAWRNGKHLIGF